MAVAGAQYFSLLDPFMARVHDFINEYRPLTDRLKSANLLEGRCGVFATLFSFPVAQWLPLVAAAGTLWWKNSARANPSCSGLPCVLPWLARQWRLGKIIGGQIPLDRYFAWA